MSFNNYLVVCFKKKRYILLLALLLTFVSLANTPSFSVPNTITITMFQLRDDGSSTEILCTERNRKAYGCTAIPGDEDYAYPFDSPQITINVDSHPVNGIEQGYLYNVVPHEVAISVSSKGNKPLSCVQAQAIASRTFAYYHIQKKSTINNSNQYQVYIPFKYYLLTQAQMKRVQEALAEIFYMTPSNSTDPIRAHYGANNNEWTTDGGEPYLKSVHDPISAPEGRDEGTENGGMSGYGCSRWGFGHTSSRGAVAEEDPLYPHDNQGDGEWWSVQWDEAFQILTHYYTNIHLRDVNGVIVSPKHRWNFLSIDWGEGARLPPPMIPSETYSPTLEIQNSGTLTWTSETTFSCLWHTPTHSTVECDSPVAVNALAPGLTQVITLPITPDAAWFNGLYTLSLDAKQGDTFFSQYASTSPWFSLDYTLCVGEKGCQTNFPFSIKDWPQVVFIEESFNLGVGHWSFYTIPSTDPTSYVYVSLDGRTDNASLFLGEADDHSGVAETTFSVPPNGIATLGMWCKKTPNATWPIYGIWVDHTQVSSLVCGTTWKYHEISIDPQFIADEELILAFRVTSYPIHIKQVLIDDLRLSVRY